MKRLTLFVLVGFILRLNILGLPSQMATPAEGSPNGLGASDLMPISMEGPKIADAWETITVNWKVANGGDTVAYPSWTDRLYLSQDTQLDGNDRTLGDTKQATAVASQASYTAELTCIVPNVAPGAYYLIVEVDHYNKVIEASEKNQTYAIPLKVRVPDLTPINMEGPKIADAWETITVNWKVANVGDTLAYPSWTDRLYLSQDAQLDASDRALGDTTQAASVPSQGSYTAELKCIVPNVAPGAYYLIAEVDHYNKVFEVSETNQYYAIPLKVRVPDLTPISMEGPKIADAWETITVNWKVANIGDTLAYPSWTDRLYLSQDAQLDANDRALSDLTQAASVPSQGSYLAELKCLVPNVAPGAYYLIVEVDHYNKVFEVSETNQYYAIPLKIRVPDLRPTELATTGVPEAGQSMVARWAVANAGDCVAFPSWTDRLYLSTDSVYDSSDRVLGDVTHSAALVAGTNYQAELKFTVPNVPAGIYYVILQADHYNQVFEHTETNNLMAAVLGGSTQPPNWIALAPARGGRPPQQMALNLAPSVQRVELTINDQVYGTYYGAGSGGNSSRFIDLAQAPLALSSNQVVARGYGVNDELVATTESLWSYLTEGMLTEVRVDQPSHHLALYADDIVAGDNLLLLRAYAAYLHVWRRPNLAGPGMVSGEEWLPFTEGDYQLRFFVDSELVHTATNGLVTDPAYYEFLYNVSGLALGEHTVTVNLIAPEGYRYASDYQAFTVEQRAPELVVSRAVVAAGNRFDVTLTLRNRGSGSARVQRLVEPISGFQPCVISSSLALDQSVWNYSPETRQGNLELDFASSPLAVGASATVSYQVVPILYRSDAVFEFGGDTGRMVYASAAGTVSNQVWRTVTTQTSPWGLRRNLAEAVADACHSADYLLVTDPVNLQNAFDAANTAMVLTNLAELATLRNGVLGYYHGIGNQYTSYRANTPVGVGHILRNSGAKDQIFYGRTDQDCIRCFAEDGQLTLCSNQLPIEVSLEEGDAIALGNVFAASELSAGYHARDEIVVGWGDGHGDDSGRVFIYMYEYATNYFFTRFELRPTAEAGAGFHTGDKLAVGEIWSDAALPQTDDIIIAHTNGTVTTYDGGGWPINQFRTHYRAGNLFAVGDLLGPLNRSEIVVGDVSANTLWVYLGTALSTTDVPGYAAGYSINVTLAPEDGLAVGDVLGDSYAEIVVADASEDRFNIYGYEAATDRFVEVGRFDLDYHADDEIACGRFDSQDKEQILVLRGHSIPDRHEGTVEIVSYFAGESPGDRWALDGLLNVGGRWANAMATNWTSAGHLLLVGENEIIPAFTKSWPIDDFENHGRVDFTDCQYASTGVDTDMNTPELAVGRLVGNSAARLIRALQTAQDVARNPSRLRNHQAYCISGPDPEDDGRFIDNRNSIADKLMDRGFSVLEQRRPDAVTFFANEEDQDVIFLTGHGSPYTWGDCLSDANVNDFFDPGTQRPMVYAMSCLTGRYANYNCTLSEQFLWKKASAYLGATEVTYGWGDHGRGWSPRFAEAFFSRLAAGRTLGETLKLTKRYRLSDAANTYSSDWNKNRYHCAAYHLYGDPKLQIQWPAALGQLAQAEAGGPRRAGNSEPVPGPLSEFALTVPGYVVTHGATGDAVEIPDGEWLGMVGRPEVPFYPATILFPKGAVVQSVSLKSQSGLNLGTGLKLDTVTPSRNAQKAGVTSSNPLPGWWPENSFEWSATKNPDGTRTLAIKTLAFQYQPETTESRFYSNWVFQIDWWNSTVDILQLEASRRVYPVGAEVLVDLTVQNTAEQAVDATAVATILVNDTEVVAELPGIPMPALKKLGWAQFRWNSANQPGGDYALEVRIRDNAGHELDRQRTEFQLGRTAGLISSFVLAPQEFHAGDQVQLALAFDNTGSVSLDGAVVVLVENAAGEWVAEFRQPFSALAAGASFHFDPVWANATLDRSQCRFLVYAEFAGQTTAIAYYEASPDSRLYWDSIQADNGAIQLTWPSVEGRKYSVEFTSELGAIPFSCIASNLPATPPRNLFQDEARQPHGFYRLKRDN